MVALFVLQQNKEGLMYRLFLVTPACLLVLIMSAPACANNASQSLANILSNEDSTTRIMLDIRRLISQSWKQPASFDPNMQVLLRLKLNQNGDLISIRILESSGNSAFDSSAVSAIRKFSPFEAVKNADAAVFKMFETIDVMFKPGG